jgi:hypothetical protein
MPDHRALKTLAESPDAVRALARYLLAIGARDPATAWTNWELDFLDNMATRDSPEPLSMRQREVLDDLRSAAERHTEIDGISVRNLIERCWLERADLGDDDDQTFIEDLRASGQRSVTRRQRSRLLRLCRETGVLD